MIRVVKWRDKLDVNVELSSREQIEHVEVRESFFFFCVTLISFLCDKRQDTQISLIQF